MEHEEEQTSVLVRLLNWELGGRSLVGEAERGAWRQKREGVSEKEARMGETPDGKKKTG